MAERTTAHLSDEDIYGLVAEGGSPPAHLIECDACRARYGELAAFVAAASSPPAPEPDWEAQRRAVMKAVGRDRPRRRAWLRLGAVAAVLVLAVGVSYFAASGLGGRGQAMPALSSAQQAALLDLDDGATESDFDNRLDFLVPMPEESNETGSNTVVRPERGPDAGRGLA